MAPAPHRGGPCRRKAGAEMKWVEVIPSRGRRAAASPPARHAAEERKERLPPLARLPQPPAAEPPRAGAEEACQAPAARSLDAEASPEEAERLLWQAIRGAQRSPAAPQEGCPPAAAPPPAAAGVADGGLEALGGEPPAGQEAAARFQPHRCPGGHALQRHVVRMESVCSLCLEEFAEGTPMRLCRTCDFEVCHGCVATGSDGAGSDGAGGSGASSGAERPAKVQAAPESAPARGTACRAQWQPSSAWGGEDIVGPDGEIYEVFYPKAHEDDELEGPDGMSTQLPGSPQDLELVEEFETWQPVVDWVSTEAEVRIAAMVEHMSRQAVSSYPARHALFETVKAATEEALGDHFDSFALVGSTAMRIDTPDSDLDAVAFTKDAAGSPEPRDALRLVAERLEEREGGQLGLQLVPCARVPVLTVLSADGTQSLDLTVNETVGLWHVWWFQTHRAQLVTDPIPLQYVPAPALEGSSQGLEADALRCVKWWLRRRRIPVAKEGGYPSVVWTLVVLHVLRCSLFLAGGDGQRDSLTLLGALAAFFDRLAESGLTGTFFFEGGTNAAFLQGAAAAPPASGLSVIDPTTTCEESVAWGITPTDLAPKTSAATQLLHRCELRRAQRLSAIALGVGRVDSQERAAAELSGAEALQELFADVGESVNSLPSEVPAEPCAVVAVQEGGAVLTGLLEQVRPKPGWTAPFLRRDDIRSGFALRRCEVDTVTGSLVEYQDADALEWFHPSDFVCAVPLRRCREPAAGRQQAHRLEPEGLRRLLELRAVAPCAAPPACAMPWAAGAARDARKKRKNGRGRGQRKACA